MFKEIKYIRFFQHVEIPTSLTATTPQTYATDKEHLIELMPNNLIRITHKRTGGVSYSSLFNMCSLKGVELEVKPEPTPRVAKADKAKAE